MAEVVLERSEMLNGAISETVRGDDGKEFTRLVFYTCSICGAESDRPFPRSAISCFRKECLDR